MGVHLWACLTRGSYTVGGVHPESAAQQTVEKVGPRWERVLKTGGAGSHVGSKSVQRRHVSKTPEESHMWGADGEEKPGWLVAQRSKVGTS